MHRSAPFTYIRYTAVCMHMPSTAVNSVSSHILRHNQTASTKLVYYSKETFELDSLVVLYRA
jgi:hypothetical protein